MKRVANALPRGLSRLLLSLGEAGASALPLGEGTPRPRPGAVTLYRLYILRNIAMLFSSLSTYSLQ